MWRRCLLGRVVLVLGLVILAVPTFASRPTPEFEYPAALKIQVEFWKQIFAVYSSKQIVIHDVLHLDWVYSVVDLTDVADTFESNADLSRYADDRIKQEKSRIQAMLRRLHEMGSEPHELTGEEKKLRTMLSDDHDPLHYLNAAADDRIRGQRGLKEKFSRGIVISRRYLPEMEAIFRSEGVPVGLTRLPLVESCFNVQAYSKVGAAGMWQFMPSTGRLYLRINDQVDERRDPIAATHAAARLLRGNYDALGTWPLAITAYNHGRAGMARAVDRVGTTDIAEIIREYDGPAFKFASRNFYPEFLAALEVEHEPERYFGRLDYEPPMRTEKVKVPDPVSIGVLAQACGTSVSTLAELNPALTPDVAAGRRLVPKGHALCVPEGANHGFEARYAALKPRLQAKGHGGKATAKTVHKVRAGQTLVSIAHQYRTSVSAIQRHNGLRTGAPLKSGQQLTIPKG